MKLLFVILGFVLSALNPLATKSLVNALLSKILLCISLELEFFCSLSVDFSKDLLSFLLNGCDWLSVLRFNSSWLRDSVMESW